MDGFGPTNGELMLRAMIWRYWISVGVKSTLFLIIVGCAIKYLFF